MKLGNWIIVKCGVASICLLVCALFIGSCSLVEDIDESVSIGMCEREPFYCEDVGESPSQRARGCCYDDWLFYCEGGDVYSEDCGNAGCELVDGQIQCVE